MITGDNFQIGYNLVPACSLITSSYSTAHYNIIVCTQTPSILYRYICHHLRLYSAHDVSKRLQYLKRLVDFDDSCPEGLEYVELLLNQGTAIYAFEETRSAWLLKRVCVQLTMANLSWLRQRLTIMNAKLYDYCIIHVPGMWSL